MVPQPTGITHIEITVSDLNASLHFYRDIVGLRQVPIEPAHQTEQEMANDNIEGIYEIGQRKWRYAVLRYAGAADKPFRSGYEQCAIVLIQPYDPPPTGCAIKLDQVGISHFSLLAPGPIEKLEARMVENGVKVVGWQTATDPKHPSRSIFVEDPDGILLQLDVLPAVK
jgi:catechol 2,3-dioxygenase-like lactoylglutathione lyase family enzyme